MEQALPHRWTRTELLRIENLMEEGKTFADIANVLQVPQKEVEAVLRDKLKGSFWKL